MFGVRPEEQVPHPSAKSLAMQVILKISHLGKKATDLFYTWLNSTFKTDPYLISAFIPPSTLLTHETTLRHRQDMAFSPGKEISRHQMPEKKNKKNNILL